MPSSSSESCSKSIASPTRPLPPWFSSWNSQQCWAKRFSMPVEANCLGRRGKTCCRGRNRWCCRSMTVSKTACTRCWETRTTTLRTRYRHRCVTSCSILHTRRRFTIRLTSRQFFSKIELFWIRSESNCIMGWSCFTSITTNYFHCSTRCLL